MSVSAKFAQSATVQPRRRFAYIAPPEDDPVTELLKRGRKSPSQWGHELTAAERFGVTARKGRVA